MRGMKSVKVSLGALALAGCIAAASLAQAPQGPPQGPAQGQGQRGPGMMRGGAQMTPEQMQQRRTEMEQRQAERAKLLHDALGIQPNQENAWKAYQDAMKPPAPPAPPAANAAPLSIPQRADQQMARANERAAEVKKRGDATKRLYAALTPTQQKSFEALQQMNRGGRDGMRGERRGMRGPGFGRGGPGGPGGPDGPGGPPPRG